MNEDSVNLNSENFPHISVDVLLDILAWQFVQRDFMADQLAETTGQPEEEWRARLDDQKVFYRHELLKILAQKDDLDIRH